MQKVKKSKAQDVNTIMSLFYKQVERGPNHLSVNDGTTKLTYQELDEKTNQLTWWLYEQKMMVGDVIALFLEPGIDFIVCILAIIKAGCVYLPLDTQAPIERIKEIVTDAGAKLILTDNLGVHLSNIKVFQFAEVAQELEFYSKELPSVQEQADHPVVLFYTSGSTGKPKGVLIVNRSIINLAICNGARFDRTMIMAQFSNFAFDASSLEIWSALLNGAKLFIINSLARKDYILLKEVLVKNQVNCVFLPTAYFHQLASFAPDTLDSLNTIIFGGEQVNSTVLVDFLQYRKNMNLPIKLINAYGPTEATTVTCYQEINEAILKNGEQLVSIGKPIPNVKVYVLDADMQPVKSSEEGELYISGINLALGYHNAPLLNEEKFLPNPFAKKDPYKRMYKTGDLVKQLPTGELVYIGRIDDQVKVSGYRVHLNEIESCLLKHQNIGAAAVIVEKGGGAYTILKAYLVGVSPEVDLDPDDIRTFLQKALPPYMIPAKYVKIRAMPLTSIGKVDRKALIDFQGEDLIGANPMNTSDFVEKKLLVIWKNLLNRDSIDVNKNFFDLGANSLIITAACIQINKVLSCSLQVSDILTYPSVHKLGLYLEGYLGDVLSPVRKDRAPLEIAIVGMSCRFPKANSLAEFWDNLSKGRDCLTHFDSGDSNDINFVPVKGVIDGIDEFDAGFFGFNPADASVTDPQQRIFLECAWEALEHSGNTPSKNSTKTFSVYAGMADSRYLQENLLQNKWFKQNYNWFNTRIVTSMGTLATQLSYRLNLHGKSININTACSTGLVALDQACQDLTLGNSDVALVGAVSIDTYQRTGYLYHQGGIESADGFCKPFSKDATGTVFSDGCGVVVLKRLSDAIKDNDTIYAVIKGCGINNDGAEKIGYAAPSTVGQMSCITDAIEQAQILPEQIGFVEAHGTATALGDVVEFKALTNAYQHYTAKTQYCALGSVKSNIGHTDVAAGMAGLIKAVLCLYYKYIPPTLYFTGPNPNIQFGNSPFYVNTDPLVWENRIGKRYAGVSAFGIGGTNAHIVLGEYRQEETQEAALANKLFILSAKDREGVEQSTQQLLGYLKQKINMGSNYLADVAYTLQTGRDDFQYRRFAFGKTVTEIIDSLSKSPINEIDFNPKVVFIFAGQGVQYSDMVEALYKRIPYFASIVNECANIAKLHLGCDILPMLFKQENPHLYQTEFAQPILFIIEYALAKLLTYFGVVPGALIGYGVGEYIAACFAEVFSLEDAIAAICKRGQLAADASVGEVIIIECTREEFVTLTKGLAIDLAAHNSQHHCTASGPANKIAELEKRLQEAGKKYEKTNFKRAFHSCSMEKASQQFQEYLSNFSLSKPKIAMLSNITGSWLKASVATNPCYWGQHLRHTVEFYQGIETLAANDFKCFIEIGSGAILNDFVRDIVPAEKLKYLDSILPKHEHKINVEEQLLTMLGSLWQLGLKINWLAFYNEERRRHVSLPTYVFKKQSYWLESDFYTHSIVNKKNIEKIIPRSKYEVANRLIEIWKSSLKLQDINVNDDYFSLGGDSLKAIGLLSAINKEFNSKFDLLHLHEASTISALAEIIFSKNQNQLAQ